MRCTGSNKLAENDFANPLPKQLHKSKLTLLDLLESIHGLLSSCGDERIIIRATNHNHIDRVDAALLHPLNIDSENKNRGEALKRECITKSILGLEDLQRHFGGRRDDAANNFGATRISKKHGTNQVSIVKRIHNQHGIQQWPFCQKSRWAKLRLLWKAARAYAATAKEFHGSNAKVNFLLVENNRNPDIKKGNCNKSSRTLTTVESSSRDDCAGMPPNLNTSKRSSWASLRLLWKATRAFAAAKEFCGTNAEVDFPLVEEKNRNLDIKKGNCNQSLSIVTTVESSSRDDIAGLLPDLDTSKRSSWANLRLLWKAVSAFIAAFHSKKGNRNQSLSIVATVKSSSQDDCAGMFPDLNTSESASSSRWPIGLLDGGNVVLLDPLEQPTKNAAHVAKEDLCSPIESPPKKKMVRKSLKRKCRTMSSVFDDHRQHFGRRCEGTAKSLGATRICMKHGINRVSSMNHIHKPHGIHWWPFRQKWARRKGYSLGSERTFEVSSVSMDDILDSRLLFFHMPQFARYSLQTSALPDGGKIVGPLALSSSELAATNNRAHYVRQDQNGYMTSHCEWKSTRVTSDRQGIAMSLCCIKDLHQHFGCKHNDVVKRLGVNVPMFERTCRQHRIYCRPRCLKNNERKAFDATNNRAHLIEEDQSGPTVSNLEKETMREASNRKCITKSVLISEDLRQNYGGGQRDAAKSLCDSLVRNSLEVLDVLPLWEESNTIEHLMPRRRLALQQRWIRPKKSLDLPRTLQMNCTGGLTVQFASSLDWPIGLPVGGHVVSLSKKIIVRKTFKRECRTISVSFEGHQQHFGSRCEDVANSPCVNRICEQHGISLVPTVKRIHRQHGIHRLPFRQSAVSLPDGGYVLSVSEKKIMGKTLKRKCKTMSLFSLEDDQQHGVRRWGDAVKSLGRKRICRQLVVQHVPRAKHIHRQHVFHRWPFQQSAVGLPDGGYVLSVGKTLKRKCKTMSLFSLEDDQQHGVKRWGDAAKSLGRKRICRQLVVQHVSIAKRIHRQHVFHRWPFQQVTHLYFHFYQNWETMKAYSVRDKRPAKVLSLSMDGKLVSRLQLVHISWLVKFLPRPSAYRGGGEIVGPIALLSSEFAATNNRAHGIRNDQSGSSSASHFEEEIPGEPVDVEGTGSGISLEELQQLFDMKREDAAEILKVSVSTFKRICRRHGIKPWPYQARKKAVTKPPDRHRGMNTTGSSDDRRNLSASQEEPLLRGHVSGPIHGTIPTCTDPAPGQPTTIVSHPTGNLLASEEEVLLRGHVSGPIYGTICSCTDPALSQTTPIVPHPTGNLEHQRNLVALPEEPLVSQPTPSIPLIMEDLAYWNALFDNSFPEGHASGPLDCTAPTCSNPAPSQTTPTNATEMRNMDFVELKATYDDATFGNTTIKFQLPPKFETSELEEKVSKILKCELDSFRVEYKDKDDEWILMGCDENVREYLQLHNSLGNQVTKLKITKVPNTTNLCETCGSSLARKRPRHA